MDQQTELLKTCVAVEHTTAEIYSQFAIRFPEESVLWKSLADEEKGHARLFLMLNCFKHSGQIPVWAPDSLPLSQKALAEVNEIKKRASGQALTHEQALDIAASLELSTIESFLNVLISKQAEGELKQLLSMLLTEGKAHGCRLIEARKRTIPA
ncbi:MAG: hypothetical protein M0Z52_09205 [Actinomycetota bacterium]|nr:hypothetical protein [Actinomycetota bacterium]